MRASRLIATALATALAATLALAIPAGAQADYGAIAVNPNTGASGVSYNYNRKARALRRARRECPGKCRITVWVRNQCGATVYNGSRFYSAAGRRKKRAIRKARRRAPGNERLVAWVCSG